MSKMTSYILLVGGIEEHAPAHESESLRGGKVVCTASGVYVSADLHCY